MNVTSRRSYITIPVLLLMAVASSVRPVGAAEALEIVRVSFATTGDGEGQIIRLHATRRIESGELEVHQETLDAAFVVVRGAKLDPALVRDRAVDPIRSYSVFQQGTNVRVDLQFDGYRPVRVIAYPDRDSNDALISVRYASVRYNAPVAPASIVSSANDQSESTEQRWLLDCVVIDAGHGGEDLGAVANGIREKDINLQVAKLLGSHVEEKLGIRVIYTRTTDKFVALEERGRIANEACGKLFVSLHVNSAPSRVAEGTEIYFLGLHKTEAAREVMERENSVIRLENNPDQYAAFGDDGYILQTLAQSAYLRESEALAGFVDAQFRDATQRAGRGVKQAGFLVLWKASMPAILVELGFITNRKEATYLKSPDGQEELADAIYQAIAAYRDFYQKGLTTRLAD